MFPHEIARAVTHAHQAAAAREDHVRAPLPFTGGQEEPDPLAARLSCRRCLIVLCLFFLCGSFGFSIPLGIPASSQPA